MAEIMDIISQNTQSTVVAEYVREERERETGYQSESDLENTLIAQLQRQGYEYLPIHNEKELIANLRKQLEKLNDITFTDSEWQRFFKTEIAKESNGIKEKAITIQRDYKKSFVREDGTQVNISLIDKKDVHHNYTQVINQYAVESGTQKNRYDVTILVNGLPLVHIELKRRGVLLKEAFNQINRYGRESFWADNALFEFVQIFIISNGTTTKYYSNTTRDNHVKEQNSKAKAGRQRTCNSYEFTSYWSDAKNKLLNDLEDFTATFLSRHSLLNILTRFCVLTEQNILMAMRPYQIAATEKILQRIQMAIFNRWQGTTRAGGFIWHTTGSGKTLTSFKTAQLASQMENVKKVLFVVDRKDLDYQTMKEYDNFEPNCANSNSSSKILLKQIKDENATIIITTIQKLSNLMKPNFWDKEEQLREILTKENIVLIFDECHRSQFGEMHTLITKRIKKYMMFGFTGTPIFAINASAGSKYKTTAQLFGGEPDDQGKPTKPLHTYTIINAIRDKNVLPFHVDYSTTMRMKSDVDRKQVWGIDTDEALHDPRRIRIVCQYILEHFAEKTKQAADSYAFSRLTNVEEVVKKGRKAEEKKQKVKTRGFNSILAVDSVKSAIMYYNELKRQLAEPGAPDLRIATIYTFYANEEEVDEWGLGSDENPEDVGKAPDMQSREALEKSIDDYNHLWEPNTSYSTDSEQFQSYYKDLSLRMKNKEIDLLIVVGMFLTGFDAKTLNTLWVDKNLKLHGLLQAYSRTNRILNAVKNCGNIVCFRNLEEATNESLRIFGDKNAAGLVFMKSFREYYEAGYEDSRGNWHRPYMELIQILLNQFPVEQMANILDEEKKKEFIRLMSEILRVRNVLNAFDDFDDDAQLIDKMRYEDYKGWYNNYYEEFRKPKHDNESINDDIEFEMELVKQVQVNIHYILQLVQKYHDENCKDKEIIVQIRKQVEASPDMRDKRDLIEKFIERMTPETGKDVGDEWEQYIEEEKKKQLDIIIQEESLKPQETEAFMKRAFADGYVTETGTGIAKILPPVNPFLPESGEKKQTVIEKLKSYLQKFLNTNE